MDLLRLTNVQKGANTATISISIQFKTSLTLTEGYGIGLMTSRQEHQGHCSVRPLHNLNGTPCSDFRIEGNVTTFE